MRRRLDLSLGQRLAIGFGVPLAVLLLLGVLIRDWRQQISAAQSELFDRIAPLSEGAGRLEQALLYVAIHTRGYLVRPTPARRQVFENSLEQAVAARQRLGSLPKSADGEALYRRLEPRVDSYLAAARGLVERRPAGAELDAAEAVLSEARESSLAEVRELVLLQERKAESARAVMSQVRRNARDGMITAGLLALGFFVLFAGFTARSIRRHTGELLEVAAALERGDWKPALAYAPRPGDPETGTVRDETRKLARAFGAAALALERREQRLEADGAVARAAAGSLRREEIAARAITAIVGHAGAEVGVVYGWNGEVLEPVAAHAAGDGLAPLTPGQGIPGQAAGERRTVLVTDIPADTPFRILLGYDEAPPRNVAAVPILYRERLYGVLVVASLRALDRQSVSFLEAAAEEIGSGFQNVEAHEHIGRLLADVEEKGRRIQSQNEELQVQSEEIQAQNEELQVQNEELQAQNEEIQAQSEELQGRQEGIRSLNEKLLEKSRILTEQAAKLEEADRRKNEFLGILAHELRNPMAPIANGLYILKRTEPGGEQARRAEEVIERQTRHLLRLIDDLLDVTRVSQGKIQLRRERLDLAELVRASVEDWRAGLEESGLQIEVDLPPGAVWVEGDATRLSQVVGNLLSNAIKFSDPGGRIEVTLELLRAEGQVALAVRDSGIGFDAEALPHLFEPFRQGGGHPARGHGGLGLGLSLVKSLTEMHGGTVEARPRSEGRGAELLVKLPVLAHEAPRPGLPAGGWRILVIEDNRDVAASLSEALELGGHQVEVAHSGPEGLDRARHFHPQVVLCDIGLPRMSGYEVARELRADEKLRSTFLVALTGYAAPEDRRKSADAGFDEHFAKPLDLDRFYRILADKS